MPGRRKHLQQLLSDSQNMTSLMSEAVANINKSNGQKLVLREYAVDAFRDQRIHLKCQDIADDQFCTSGIVIQPGELN